MLIADLVATHATVSATRSRKAKTAALAAALGEAAAEDLPVVTSWLGGALLQRRTGVGWRGLQTMPPAAASSTLTVREVHDAFDHLAGLAGAGSQQARADAVAALFGRATEEEQRWLRGLVAGELRQGALDALVQEALAAAAGVPVRAVRRAAMLAGSTVAVTAAAFEGEQALAAIGLEVGRPVLPMLASSATDVAAAFAKVAPEGGAAAVDTKLDGIRIQVHRRDDEVVIATRSLDDITHRLPEVVALARSLPATSFVLDGEAIALDEDGRPRPFQETASRTAQGSGVEVTPYFFDLLHLDGRDLLDSPGAERLEALTALVPEPSLVARLVTDDPAEADAFAASVVAAGHEGVVVKSLAAAYDAGRRGAGWVKVKPVHTLDLVVLAVEWGSGRRQGWLSNIHLGARDPSSDSGFTMLGKTLKNHYEPGWAMVGKTFKGMSDEMLAWQTERFLELQTHRDGHVVFVRPEQVVEIAFDGVQRSSRYRSGAALRFARVVRYRDDKNADEADTIVSVQDLL